MHHDRMHIAASQQTRQQKKHMFAHPLHCLHTLTHVVPDSAVWHAQVKQILARYFESTWPPKDARAAQRIFNTTYEYLTQRLGTLSSFCVVGACSLVRVSRGVLSCAVP